MSRATDGTTLPRKFTDAERAAFRRLWECGCNGWLVDLLTKRVTALEGGVEVAFPSLTAALAAFEAGEWSGNVESGGNDSED